MISPAPPNEWATLRLRIRICPVLWHGGFAPSMTTAFGLAAPRRARFCHRSCHWSVPLSVSELLHLHPDLYPKQPQLHVVHIFVSIERVRQSKHFLMDGVVLNLFLFLLMMKDYDLWSIYDSF